MDIVSIWLVCDRGKHERNPILRTIFLSRPSTHGSSAIAPKGLRSSAMAPQGRVGGRSALTRFKGLGHPILKEGEAGVVQTKNSSLRQGPKGI